MENTINTESQQSDHERSSLINLVYTEAKIPTLTVKTMLEKVKEILPQIAANAEQAEQLRQVPTENIKLLNQA